MSGNMSLITTAGKDILKHSKSRTKQSGECLYHIFELVQMSQILML